MPWSTPVAPRGRRATPARPAVSHTRCRTLLIIDNRPLQNAAWSEFHAARKRAEKAARDLHRHEQTDTVAYQAWLHGTFPVLVTTLRELHEQVTTKARQVDSVQWMAALTGRSLKKLWRELKEREANPGAFEDEPDPGPDADSAHPRSRTSADDDDFDPFGDDFFNGLFGEGPGEPFTGPGRSPGGSHNDADEHSVPSRRRPAPPTNVEARDLYRRLVQHLHPDRGGDWTPARERLWHEVQQAWAARDVDWLSRLEIDWETANDTLRPDSSLSRLRRAIAELHAARRDTERKLRDYRRSFAWRFTDSEKKRPQLHRRVETDLNEDLIALQRQLAYLNATIAAWEALQPKRRRPARR